MLLMSIYLYSFSAEEFEALGDDLDARLKWIDGHPSGKDAPCVKEWLKEEIRPEAKWNALNEDEEKELLKRGIRPFHWRSDRSDFISEEEQQR